MHSSAEYKFSVSTLMSAVVKHLEQENHMLWINLKVYGYQEHEQKNSMRASILILRLLTNVFGGKLVLAMLLCE